MRRAIALGSALGAGAIFGLGLAVAGMTKPSKVAGFLDLLGAWDASLAFVVAGAILVHLAAYRLIIRRRSPLFDATFHLPTRKDLDLRLVLGAAIFGVGWALAGYCPGPSVVSAASGNTGAIVFVIAMLVGMKVEHRLSPALSRLRTAAPEIPRR